MDNQVRIGHFRLTALDTDYDVLTLLRCMSPCGRNTWVYATPSCNHIRSEYQRIKSIPLTHINNFSGYNLIVSNYSISLVDCTYLIVEYLTRSWGSLIATYVLSPRGFHYWPQVLQSHVSLLLSLMHLIRENCKVNLCSNHIATPSGPEAWAFTFTAMTLLLMRLVAKCWSHIPSILLSLYYRS